ncbi:MAG TPA: YlxR family protein [Bacillota bacterium]|nr:YlxR family protein [Bacillota bacterium]HPE38193.1 YlxR family protein [Bacillota bacterium]
MQKKIPMRMCVTCRERKEKKDLTRIVLSPTGEISVDETGKKPGRGAYVCREGNCMAEALKGHRFEKGLHSPIGSETQEVLAAMVTERKDENNA